MTLCELATATHHSLPLECAPFTVDSEAATIRTQGECVDALSRSAQFWSSYSGYLREVPQLCFAFRRWNDIDTAKDIYKNSTLEMATLIRLLLAREKADVEGKKRWDTRVSELEDVAIRLDAVSNLIDAMMNAATPRLQSELATIVNTFRTELRNIQINTKKENSRIIDQIGSELQLISQRHANSLNDFLPFLENSLVNDLKTALSPFQTQSLQALELANSAQEAWINLTLQFSAMQQKILELSGGVSTTFITIEASAKQAQVVHDAQIVASVSASHLADTLTQLTTTAHDSLDKLNASASQLAQSFSPRNGLIEFIRLIEVVLPVDSSIIAHLHHLPIFPVVSASLSFLLYILRSSFSALMGIALLFFSSRKYIIKPMYDQDAAANACHVVPPFQSHPSPRPPRILRDPEISSRPGIRKSRIPDRLCNIKRSS
ncbi:hypothetical protein C8F04DRAFT_1085231 [Mycena alexandri]|uniref:Nuclear fusion protein KAR5 n=1 Tax=Mycena alexandri TaxID=1745969 RepID=A0AAD6T632_9AGAR|nr:hypothetical protein C8F04DRAFT_1085231 [Mycena alexandri]